MGATNIPNQLSGNVQPAGNVGGTFSGLDILEPEHWSAGTTPSAAAVPAPIAGAEIVPPSILGCVAVLLDALMIVGSALLAYASYYVLRFQDWDMGWSYTGVGVLGALLFGQRIMAVGGYTFPRITATTDEIRDVAVAWTITVAIVVAALLLLQQQTMASRGWFISWYLSGLLGLTLGRGLLHQILARLQRAGMAVARPLVVIGPPDVVRPTVRHLRQNAPAYLVTGREIDMASPRAAAGTVDRLVDSLRARCPDTILVMPFGDHQTEQTLLQGLRELPANVLFSPLVEAPRLHRGAVTIGQLAALRIWDRPLDDYQQLLKRASDIVVAGVALLALAPFLAIIAIAVRLDSPGPIIFRQPRFGFNNQRFYMLKFRTMFADRGDTSGQQRTVRDDPRVTGLGRLLRRTSIDELPQLWNVLRGDMAIVGPRAHPVAMKVEEEYYHEVVEQYFARHRMRPGITGWAQVNGLRGEVDTLDKARRRVAYDLYYVENWSIFFDIRIMLLTAIKGFVGKNAY